MNEQLLFNVPATGEKKKPVAKPAGIKINRVNRVVAKSRYYWHRQLNDQFEVFAAERKIKTDYESFTAIPRGKQRYAIDKLLKMGYQVQYKLFK